MLLALYKMVSLSAPRMIASSNKMAKKHNRKVLSCLVSNFSFKDFTLKRISFHSHHKLCLFHLLQLSLSILLFYVFIDHLLKRILYHKHHRQTFISFLNITFGELKFSPNLPTFYSKYSIICTWIKQYISRSISDIYRSAWCNYI